MLDVTVRDLSRALGRLVEGCIAQDLAHGFHRWQLWALARSTLLLRVRLRDLELSTERVAPQLSGALVASATKHSRVFPHSMSAGPATIARCATFDKPRAGLRTELGYLKNHLTSLVRPNNTNHEVGVLMLLSTARRLLPRCCSSGLEQ